MKTKDLTIDIAKGIAIILVVYGHVIQHSMEPWSGQAFFLNPVFKIIYTFHMPLFVFISGYLVADSLNRKSTQDVLKSRFKSLFIPCIFLGILGTILTYLLNMIFGINIGRIDLIGDLADQLFLRPAVWFLFTLFVLSFLLMISVELEKRFGVIVYAFIYVLIAIIPFNNYFDLYYIKWFYLFYLAGYFYNRSKIKISSKAMLCLALVLFSWFVGYWTKYDYIYINKMNFVSNLYFYEIVRIIYRYLMGFLGIILIYYVAAYFSKTRMGSLLGRIGEYSLDIYVIQMFILEGVYTRLIYKSHIQLDFNSAWVLYGVAPVIAVFFVGLCVVTSKLCFRKNPLLDKLILGGRH